MPVGLFVAPFQRADHQGTGRVRRESVMHNYNQQIVADGGAWQETEILGQRVIAKVRASGAVLTSIAADPLIVGLPATRLDDPLSTLTVAQRTALRQLALDCGYSTGEFASVFPNLGQATLGQFLRFLCTRRRKVRYDQATDTIVDDGQVEPVTSIDLIDALVA